MSEFTVPKRSPSKKFHERAERIEEQKLRNRESRNELKRKLSSTDTKADNGRIALKLSIDELELERDELELDMKSHALELDMGISNKKFFKKVRLTHLERKISIGDQIWSMRRSYRRKLEEDGILQMLTPDSEGAFVPLLLSLYSTKENKRKSQAQSSMKNESIELYDAIDPGNARNLFCSITGEYWDKEDIVAAHIVPSRLGAEVVDYIFGPGKGLRLFSPDNCLLMHPSIERAYDNGNIAIIPFDSTQPITRWKTVLINKDAANQRLYPDLRVGDLDQKELVFKSNFRPASRFLYFTFITSLLRSRANRNPGWMELWESLRSGKPWATPGKYLRKSMLLTLAKAIGDVDEGEIDALVRDHIFDANSVSAEAEADLAFMIEKIVEAQEE
ncbi:MAG: hypothetical protein M1829_006859 [Trizodia sp. TS-e1964]|nr:MAG: hypothetical protein M1829_006859 [Trizodia sp. TS-e1964]